MFGLGGFILTKDEQARVDYAALKKNLKDNILVYHDHAREWHRAANIAAGFSPGLAAILRDVANAMSALGQRAADMKQLEQKP